MNATRRALLLAVGGLGLSRLSRNVSAQTGQSRPADAFMQLPPNLPVPVDDGACRHLSGMKVPSVPLQSTANRSVDLSRVDAKRVVVYAYPRTGAPGQPVPAGWDEIPGARGCTPETCGFRDHHQELKRLGVTVYGLSTQTTAYQEEMIGRLHVPFEVLSDEHLALTHALRLPTFEFGGDVLLKRLTLVISNGRIDKVFYPVFPPDTHAEEVVKWLKADTKG
jgi:peroxiredoxin